MGALDANPYYFKDKDGFDLLNVRIQKRYKEYGELKKYITNDFVTNEKIGTICLLLCIIYKDGKCEKVVS